MDDLEALFEEVGNSRTEAQIALRNNNTHHTFEEPFTYLKESASVDALAL